MFLLILIVCVFIYILYSRRTLKYTVKSEKFIHNDNQSRFPSNKGKIAFLFLTRDNINIPEIWQKYLKGKEELYSIYCHPKYPEKVNGLLKSHIIPEKIPTSWGTIGTVKANLMLIKNALKDPDNRYFILCSESCIPITRFDIFYEFIFQKDDISFIPYFVENTERWDNIKNPIVKKEEFKKHCAQGLTFCRKHAEILSKIDETDNWKNVTCVDESYFYNILYWQNPNIEKELENYKITFDAWGEHTVDSGARNRGLIRDISDNIRKKDGYINYLCITDDFVQNIVDSGYFFMRKVYYDLDGKNVVLDRV